MLETINASLAWKIRLYKPTKHQCFGGWRVNGLLADGHRQLQS
jgi:hypothetical protein